MKIRIKLVNKEMHAERRSNYEKGSGMAKLNSNTSIHSIA